jgi:2-hydroxychromene-2-carboxylate isomerase
VYGDFNCPWSYLASRRAARMAVHGIEVDWRAVEHDPRAAETLSKGSERLNGVRADMEKVAEVLLPGEQLPYSLAGFVPNTGAAIDEYATAYNLGEAERVRQVLFEALWLHSVDLDDVRVVHTIVGDAIMQGGASSGESSLKRNDHTNGVVARSTTSTALGLRRMWVSEWRNTGRETVPVIVVEGADPIFGIDAVEWLGLRLLNRRLTGAHEAGQLS